MKICVWLFIVFLPAYVYGQVNNTLEAVNKLANDSIFVMPKYIPILESENDSIRYGYKIRPANTLTYANNDEVEEIEVPFKMQRVNKADFYGGDYALLSFIYGSFRRNFVEEAGKNGNVYQIGYTTVRYRITRSGEVCDVEIVKCTSPKHNENIKKVIWSLPKYVPAKASTIAPQFYCILSISYLLGEQASHHNDKNSDEEEHLAK